MAQIPTRISSTQLLPGISIPALPSRWRATGFRSGEITANPRSPQWRNRLRMASFKGVAFYVEQHTSHYSATKGGVLTFVRNAALDLADYGIRINTMEMPGIL